MDRRGEVIMIEKKNDDLESKIGENYVDFLTGKSYLTIMDTEGEYKNTREYVLMDNETGKRKKIIISHGKSGAVGGW